LVASKWNQHRVLKITSEPYCGGNPESQLTNDLVFGTEDMADIDGIILSFPELFKMFLVKYLRWTNCFEAAGGKAY
jgi:hypothetical protein